MPSLLRKEFSRFSRRRTRAWQPPVCDNRSVAWATSPKVELQKANHENLKDLKGLYIDEVLAVCILSAASPPLPTPDNLDLDWAQKLAFREYAPWRPG